MSDPIRAIGDRIAAEAKRATGEAIRNSLPEGVRRVVGNPDDDEGDEDEDTDDDGEEDGDDDTESFAFEDTGYPDAAEDNQAQAVACYRVWGGPDHIVAAHEPTGYAFFGTEEELDDYVKAQDLDDDGWTVYDDASEIMSMEYDPDTIRDLLTAAPDEEIDAAKEQYGEIQWGLTPRTNVVKNIPGIEVPLTQLGIGRKLDYFSGKGGELAEYTHNFGEESGTFPGVYVGPDGRFLVIHGGGMHVEDRGIVD